MTERRPADEQARSEALAPERSFIVQAPAGSGKTELLTQRFLRLLGVVDRPEEIVAITFTRKAAGEMRSRIQEALELGREEAPPEEAHRRKTWVLAREALARDAALGWNLVGNPRRLRIETIDALNAWLARQLPVSSRLGAAPVIASDPEPIYRQAVRDILLEAGSDAPHAAHSAALLRHLSARFSRAEDLLVGLLKARDHWLGKVISPRGMPSQQLRAKLDAALENFVADELRRARESLPRETWREVAESAAGAAERAPELEWLAPLAGLAALPEADATALPQWQALAQLMLTKQGGWRKRGGLNVNAGFPPDAKAEKARFGALLETLAAHVDPETLARVRKLPDPAYDDARWAILEHLLALLPLCAAALEVEFAARGEADYVGIAQAALRALGECDAPTDLALALDCRIRHLLVDEFQDTSQAQVELLERLTAGWTPGDGRSLFCVGDPMQSIYRFREADVGRFLRAQQAGIGQLPLEPLRLEVNFRSQGALVEWVSAAFPDIFPRTADLSLGAVPFAPSEPWHEALPGEPLQCVAVPPRQPQREAEAVVGLVRDLRAREPKASIAVLVRSRRHLDAIRPALRLAGLPCRAVEIERLAEGPAIRDLEALARALCHRADRVAWLAVLRAPWCGLLLPDLLVAAGAAEDDVWSRLQDPAVLAAMSADGQARVHQFAAAMAPAVAARGRRPLRRVVEGAWLALGGPATLERDSELTDAERFFAFLEAQAGQADLDDPAALAELLKELYAAPETLADDAVQLLTIHKAKGLEFDHVILPGLEKQGRGNDKPLLRWLEQVRPDGAELILAPIEAYGEDSDPLHKALQDLDARRDQLELDRLLYVATTRARRRLHLVAAIGPDHSGTGAPFKPRGGTLLERLWAATGSAFLAARPAAPDPERAPAPRPPAVLRRLELQWRPPPLHQPVAWTGDAQHGAAPGAAVEYDWSGREARALGLAVHRMLQVISREGPAAWDEGRLAGCRELLEALLREAGLAPTDAAIALERALDALRNTLRDDHGRWLLDPAHPQARSELPLSGWLDGQLVNGIVDRSFLAGDTLWIVDYKAGRHEGAGLESFLDQERERYRPQLERYARLMRAGHPGPIRLGLYFPQHTGWREWDYRPDRNVPDPAQGSLDM